MAAERCNREGKNSAAERFHLIDNAAKTIYIPTDKRAPLLDALRRGEVSRGLFRKLGQYGVSVYAGQFQELLQSGYIVCTDENHAILEAPDLYHEDVGLSAVPYGEAIFQ